jgi:hypothetical protein
MPLVHDRTLQAMAYDAMVGVDGAAEALTDRLMDLAPSRHPPCLFPKFGDRPRVHRTTPQWLRNVLMKVPQPGAIRWHVATQTGLGLLRCLADDHAALEVLRLSSAPLCRGEFPGQARAVWWWVSRRVYDVTLVLPEVFRLGEAMGLTCWASAAPDVGARQAPEHWGDERPYWFVGWLASPCAGLRFVRWEEGE